MPVGVIRNANTTSLNVTAFDVPVDIPLNGSTSTMPTTAPSNDSTSDSNTKDVRMLGLLNPMTRSVAISRLRYATAAYIVFMAAKIDPIPIMKPTMYPTTLMG